MSSIICWKCGSREQLLDAFGDVRCLDCWGATRLSLDQAVRLLKEAEALEPATGPWKVDDLKNAGDNWMLADLGRSHTEKHVVVTTDDVSASMMDVSGPQEDAEFIVWCRNHWEELRMALAMAAAVDAPS